MFKKIGIVVVVAVAGLLLYAGFIMPKSYFISREMRIKASPEAIFPWINSARKSNEWMPWISMDPKLVMNFSGPEEGVGSQASWASEGKMGVGSSTIIESSPNQETKIKISYKKPFEGEQLAVMSIKKLEDGSSMVTWSVAGESQFIYRVMCIFMNMDKMIGENFEYGLAKLASKFNTK